MRRYCCKGAKGDVIMIPRYQTAIMSQIFSDETKFKTWLHVEMAYLEALQRN